MEPPRQNRPYLILSTILLAGAAMVAYVCRQAYETNGGFGFPLDDPWIHLQFAKNLHDFGAYSYYKAEMITSGSTSPLYTFLLATGTLVTRNWMLLSYVLGVSFLVLAGFFLFRALMLEFRIDVLFAAVGVFLVLFEPRLQWVSLSGMETTLFIALLAAAIYYYRGRNEIFLGVCAGLLLWTRPEALIFVVCVVIDVFYHDYIVRARQLKQRSQSFFSDFFWWLRRMLFAFGAVAVLYFAFNIWLSDSIFPNTFEAKITYYSSGQVDFADRVLQWFTSGHLSLFWYLVPLGILVMLVQLVRREPTPILLHVLWGGALFLAYSKNLPYLYQEGRYLMPILPSFIAVGLGGLHFVLQVARRSAPAVFTEGRAALVAGAILAVPAAQFVAASVEKGAVYAQDCKYITDRQVATARWLHDNVPPGAVVGTHDVGAIAFYSGRRIADMVGLVSPDMIQNIGSLDRLRQFLATQKTTHLAVLRNWFEIVNVNPIFQTDERRPEIMEVFAFDPRLRFTPQNATRANELAARYLASGNRQQAELLLQQSLPIDPYNSKTHLLMGRLYSAGNFEKSESEYRTALQLHPEFWDCYAGLAELFVRRNEPRKAIDQLQWLIQQSPAYAPAYLMLADLYRQSPDTAKASEYRRQYERLSKAPS